MTEKNDTSRVGQRYDKNITNKPLPGNSQLDK